MIKVKLESDKNDALLFKLQIFEEDMGEFQFLKRALMEGKKISEDGIYILPMKYFIPICNNIPKDRLDLDYMSKLSYLEYWDDYEEKHYYILEATPKFMLNWRKEGCPEIYKITISREKLDVTKEVVFKKLNRFSN